MAIGEIGDIGEGAPVALGYGPRQFYATHGILCPCPGCKSALGGPVAGTGTLGADLAAPVPSRTAQAAEFRALGLSLRDAGALLREDASRYGPSAAPRVAAAQLRALLEMPVDLRIKVLRNWSDRCLAS